ncbi:hypothetical protein ACFLTW_05150, partial [Chloroflexota bacterium]
MSKDIIITNATIVDAASGTVGPGSLHLSGGFIWTVGQSTELPEAEHAEVIDATGLFVSPGFIDLHCHLRE